MRFVDNVVDKSTKVDWRRVLVFLVAVIPYLVAWLAGLLVNALAVAGGWVVAAAKAGYETARSDR